MRSMAGRMVLKTPVMLVAIRARMFSGVSKLASPGPMEMPALAMTRSSGAAAVIQAFEAAWSVTSRMVSVTVAPSARAVVAVSARRAASRPARWSVAPGWA